MSRTDRTITRNSRLPRTISNDLYDCPTVSHRSRRIASSFRTRARNGHNKRCGESIRRIAGPHHIYYNSFNDRYSFSHLAGK